MEKKSLHLKILPKVVAETPVGSEVLVSVWRNGGLIEVTVKIDELNEGRKLKTPCQKPDVYRRTWILRLQS